MKLNLLVSTGAPTMQMPSDVAFQSPLQGFTNGALGGLQQLASAYQMFNTGKNQGSQAKSTDTLLPFQVKDLTESYKLKQAQTYGAWQLGDLYYNQAEVASRTQEVQVMQANEQLRFMRLRNTQMFLSNEQQTILNQWLPAEKHVAFDMAIAGVTNAYLSGELTKQQAITEGTKRLKMLSDIKVNDADIRYKDALTENVNAQTVGVALDNQIKSWDLYSAQKLTEKYIEAKLMSYDAEISGYGLEIASNNYQRRLYEPETWYDYGRSFFHEVGEYLRGAFGGLLSGSFDLGKPFQGNNRRPIGFIGRIK